MARKYRTLEGLGRCSIALHGASIDQGTRMIVALQETTQRFFVVLVAGRRHEAIPVTSIPPHDLLSLMDGYWLKSDFSDVEEPEAIGQLVAGK